MASSKCSLAGSSQSLSRTALARTVPKPAVELADAQVKLCWACRRNNAAPNPCPSRHPGDTLNFANAVECLPCRNYQNSCCRGIQKTLKAELKDDAKHADYMKSLGQHELLFDASKGKHLKDVAGQIFMPTFVQTLQEEGTEDRELAGYFWCKEILDANKVAYDPAALESYKRKQGLFRNPCGGLVKGDGWLASQGS